MSLPSRDFLALRNRITAKISEVQNPSIGALDGKKEEELCVSACSNKD